MTEIRSEGSREPANILCYRSDDLVARAIRFFDDAEVDHTGLLINADTVGESVGGEGLVQRSLKDSMAAKRERADVMELASPPPSMDPVLAKANELLSKGADYAYGQIALLAGICFLRRIDESRPLMRRLAKAAIDRAAAFVRWCQSNGKQPMICSEFVYRCYDEAVDHDNNPYSIEIDESRTAGSRHRLLGRRRRKQAATSSGIPSDSILGRLKKEHGDLTAALTLPRVHTIVPPTTVSDEEFDSLVKACLAESSGGEPNAASHMLEPKPEVTMEDIRRSIADFGIALCSASKSGFRHDEVDPSSLPPLAARAIEGFSADFVTPGDLHNSRSLTTVGKVWR